MAKSLSEIELELSKLGIRNRVWGKPEVKELAHVLTPDEVITQAANGRYQGGFALIVTTNHRLLLVDKKLWFMSLEDVRFDMVTEVDFAARLLDATISVRTINKVLRFTSIHQRNLRDLTRYLQERLMELRQMMMQQTGTGAAGPVPASLQMPDQPLPQFTVPPISQPTAQVSQPATQFYSTPTHYSRPTRLRRVGAFPTASFTVQQQRYLTAKH